jgi:hypothetical protein
MMLLLDPTPVARGLAGKKAEVVNYPDGRFAVRHEGVALPFRVFDNIQTVAPGAIVENKRLGAVLAFARELQLSETGRVSFQLCTRGDISTLNSSSTFFSLPIADLTPLSMPA